MECHVRVLNAGPVFCLPFLPQNHGPVEHGRICKGNGLLGWTRSMDQSGVPNGMSRRSSKGVERPSWKANFGSASKHPKMIIVEVSLDGIIPVVCGRRFPSKRMPTRRDLYIQHTNQNTLEQWKLIGESWLFGSRRRIMEMGGII